MKSSNKKLPIGTKVRVKNQSITGEVVRYDGLKLVIKDDDRTGWNEGEEGTLVYRERELELNKDELQSKIAPTFSVDGGEPMI